MDTFCLGCHDADGASTIAVNDSNPADGLQLGAAASAPVTGRALTPFNVDDTLTNGRDPFTRSRVVDVKSQFYAGSGGSGTGYNGNPSQHAVIGARYSTTDPNWTAPAWTSHVLKNGSTMNQVRETATLHCSDCHLSEVNAHGAVDAWHLLQNGTPGNGIYTTAPYTTDEVMGGEYPSNNASVVCYKCHSSSTYTDPVGPGTRFEHDREGRIWSDSDYGGTVDLGAKLGPTCLQCHSGDGFGRIHGRGSGTDGDSGTYGASSSSTYTKYRFMPGAWFEFSPKDGGGGTDTDWETAVTSGTQCYFTSDATYSDCAHHGGGNAGSSDTYYVRPLKY
jgi:hypothetical protein